MVFDVPVYRTSRLPKRCRMKIPPVAACQVERAQPRKKRQRGRDGAGEQVGGEIEPVEVNAGGELGRDRAREGIGRDVEDDEVGEPGAKRGRDGARSSFIRRGRGRSWRASESEQAEGMEQKEADRERQRHGRRPSSGSNRRTAGSRQNEVLVRDVRTKVHDPSFNQGSETEDFEARVRQADFRLPRVAANRS
ncbi:uncharacterized protein A4U43_C09F11480 [Asparagus officinalis]|uniref:Uncharacterized protein n=1 Tax=Asparagus officinalis TaxID=4686 RepID=A0A5P1E8U5_ASPOF|nr:uncharacterized protein A4U43_C09F11480 [Asparagus officinalis]